MHDFFSTCIATDKEKNTLQQRLRTWAIEYNVPHTFLTSLLRILREEGLQNLPSDARTFLHTPTETIIRECASGHYFHYGLERALRERLEHYESTNDLIKINVNIDGLPLAKSSASQLWPILGQIYNNNQSTEPFLIGAYHGYKKPTNAHELLEEFCEEYLHLHNEGFSFKEKKYQVIIRAIICDAPAKSFVTGVKGHNAYFGCTKCFCEGEYYNHKMVFLQENARLRTNNNFRNRENEEHHVTVSPFEYLPIDMINSFPLDYMHVICLGVMKKMLLLLMKGPHKSRLRAAQIEALSKDILNLRKFIPIEFARRPRGLNELDRWKATEFRLFLLYLGPIVLQKYLDADYYKHFCALHIAIRILCHPEDCLRNNEYATDLLKYFVRTFKVLYGKDTIVYNIHNLIHLCEDVKRYGSLNTFCAFPFENFMKELKKMLRKSEKPLSQLNNRINERAITKCKSNFNNSNIINIPLLLHPDGRNMPLGCVNSHKSMKFAKYLLTTNSADNCCYLKDGSVFCIEYIDYKDNIPIVVGKKFCDLQSIAMYSCNSQDMNIHTATRQTSVEIVSATQIDAKAVKIFFNHMYYIMPLLHL